MFRRRHCCSPASGSKKRGGRDTPSYRLHLRFAPGTGHIFPAAGRDTSRTTYSTYHISVLLLLLLLAIAGYNSKQLYPAFGTGFLKNIVDMSTGGGKRDKQTVGNFLITETVTDKFYYLRLPLSDLKR